MQLTQRPLRLRGRPGLAAIDRDEEIVARQIDPGCERFRFDFGDPYSGFASSELRAQVGATLQLVGEGCARQAEQQNRKKERLFSFVS